MQWLYININKSVGPQACSRDTAEDVLPVCTGPGSDLDPPNLLSVTQGTFVQCIPAVLVLVSWQETRFF